MSENPTASKPKLVGNTKEAIQVLVVLVVALVIGSWIQQFLPNPDDIHGRPYPVRGAIGEPVEFRLGTVTVHGFESANHVTYSGQAAATEAIWLVFDVAFTPSDEPTVLGPVELRDAEGNQYGGFQPIASPCGPIQTGMTAQCQLAMELPVEALEGATLLIPASPMSPGVADDVVEVDLEIDSAESESLVADAKDVELAPVTYEEQP